MLTLKHTLRAPLSLASTAVERTVKYFDFLYGFARSPRRVGSICPSSSALAAALAGAAPVHSGLVLDLGAGTGVITGKLLDFGVRPQAIVAVERDAGFAAAIRQTYPNVLVVQADARDLTESLHDLHPGKNVSSIISSLPFRSLPETVSQDIAQAIMATLLARGGFLVQFSYAWWMRYPLARYGFVPRKRFLVLRNVPPAVVEVYEAPQS